VRRATEVRDVPGGVAVVDPAYRWSQDDNRLLFSDPQTADEVGATTTAVAVDAGWPHRAASLRWPGAGAVAAELRRRRWTAEELLLMARPAAPLPGGEQAEVVRQAEVHEFWDRSWRAGGVAPPDRLDEVVGQLVGREHRNDLVVAVTDVAVKEDGRVVAAAQLRVDGATAAVESVLTDPVVRGRGYADALLAKVLTLAADAGCDLVVLEADADDWPHQWYARRGFRAVGSVWDVSRPGASD
jgi:GNAT superfamily N-acetyltransferase